MSEIKTSPVSAICLDKDTFHEQRLPGSIYVLAPDSDKEQDFWYCCPCGCGRLGLLTVGNGFKPVDGPSWKWNGSIEKANLEPSVHHVGHWHGWLRDGVWVSCQ
jgi:hypothetical protein